MAETYKLLADRYDHLLGRRIQGVDETTQTQVIDMVNEGLRRGYSALQIANGVSEENYLGVASIFDDPYRSELISRTESMFAFNFGAGNSFLDSGVSSGEAMDGSDDPECAERDGKIYELDPDTGRFIDDSGEPVEDHPNGTLAWAPNVTGDLVSTGALIGAGAALEGDETEAERQRNAAAAVAVAAQYSDTDPDDPTSVLNYLTNDDFNTGVLMEIEGGDPIEGTWSDTTARSRRKKEADWETKYSDDQPRDDHGRFAGSGSSGGDVAGAVAAGAASGGFTVQPYRGSSPKTGYQVAVNGHTQNLPEAVLHDPVLLAAAIAAHLENNKDVYAKGGKLYIGGWVHEGQLVLEPSERVSSKADAISLGASRNQIAVWDNAKGEEIQTGGTGTG